MSKNTSKRYTHGATLRNEIDIKIQITGIIVQKWIGWNLKYTLIDFRVQQTSGSNSDTLTKRKGCFGTLFLLVRRRVLWVLEVPCEGVDGNLIYLNFDTPSTEDANLIIVW